MAKRANVSLPLKRRGPSNLLRSKPETDHYQYTHGPVVDPSRATLLSTQPPTGLSVIRQSTETPASGTIHQPTPKSIATDHRSLPSRPPRSRSHSHPSSLLLRPHSSTSFPPSLNSSSTTIMEPLPGSDVVALGPLTGARTDNISSPSLNFNQIHRSSPPIDHLIPIGPTNGSVNSLLRRHHTLSTGSGSRLARLEKQHALAHMGKRDRQFYGGSGDGSSLSGCESEDSDPLDAAATYSSTILPPAVSVEFCNPSPIFTLDDIVATSPRSDLFEPVRFLRGSKGSASLLSQDVTGSPVDDDDDDDVILSHHDKLVSKKEDTEELVKVSLRPGHPLTLQHSHQLASSARLDAIGDRHQDDYGHHLPAYSQIPTIYRNASDPSSDDGPTTRLDHVIALKSYQTPTRGHTQLSGCVGSKTQSMNGNAHNTLKHRSSSLNDYKLTTPATLEEEDEKECVREAELVTNQSVQSSPLDRSSSLDFILPNAPSSINLYRTTSDRVSSALNQFKTPFHSNPNSMSHWSDHGSVRESRTIKSEGRWATADILATNSITAGNQAEASPRSTDPNSIPTLHMFHKASPPSHSTPIPALPPTTNRTTATGDHLPFHPNLPSSLTTSVKPASHSSRSGSVTPIGSPPRAPAFSSNPWSPTVEEVKQLRDPSMLRQTSFDTLGSGRSVSPRPLTTSATLDSSRFRSLSGDDLKSSEFKSLHSSFNRLGLSASDDSTFRPALTSNNHRPPTAKSPLSISTSMADVVSGIASPQEMTSRSAKSEKKMILPPLVTNFARQTSSTPSAGAIGPAGHRNSSSSIPFTGPASAAAFVPVIGHSVQHNTNDPFNLQEKLSRLGGHNTAAPGIGASTWLSQKERLVGSKAPLNFTKDWASPLSGGTPSLPQSAAPRSGLPHQIQQQFLLNQQLQQLQQLQAQQQLLQQQQVQLINQGIGISAGLPNPLATNMFNPNSSSPNTASPYNLHMGAFNPSIGFPNSFNGRNGSPVDVHGSMNFGNIGTSTNQPTAPNPSRLQSSITAHPGIPLPNMNRSPPSSLGKNNSIHTMNPVRLPLNVDDVSNQGFMGNVDIQQLASRKGYNPVNFDLRPRSARFFVIKSYTEEDVHKSLKYEIWASTDLGNKRLDKAFHDSSSTGPIYLLFSVNASGHFCGMAEMLTEVDYNAKSNVWAQDKWKGIFKVRWIFVKDIPNNALRHIKLSNTPENKPITSSRDTQEVPYELGVEVLQIMSTYKSRTTLLQDYAWYEHNESLKAQSAHASNPNMHQQPQVEVPIKNRNQMNHRQSNSKQHHPQTQNTQHIRRYAGGVSSHLHYPIEITSVI